MIYRVKTDYTGGDTIPKLVKVYKNNEMDKKEDSQDEDDNIKKAKRDFVNTGLLNM